MAAYSLVSYILQIKDRHNANLILNKDGHLVHIDFGFFLTDAPGKGIKFEAVEFKLKADYVAILGGVEGLGFKRFRKNMVDGFMELNKQAAKLILLVQMVAHSQWDLSCFKEGTKQAIDGLKERLRPTDLKRKECEEVVDELIRKANDNMWTNMYDRY